jgi:hypothetical protein
MLALAPLFLGFASTPGYEDKDKDKDDHCAPNHASGCKCIGNRGVSDGTKYNMEIGNSCMPWDWDGCQAYDSDTFADGKDNDWCKDDWCYVDPLTCDQPVYKSTYFTEEELAAKGLMYLYFSYKACDSCFSGNGWVGYCECTGNHGASDGSEYSVNMGGAKTGLADVRGCNDWDGQEQYCKDYADATKYQQCGVNDWCLDHWCYVDPTKCDKPTYGSTYFPNYDLHFSYSTCNDDFTGNSWVGQGVEAALAGSCSLCPDSAHPC